MRDSKSNTERARKIGVYFAKFLIANNKWLVDGCRYSDVVGPKKYLYGHDALLEKSVRYSGSRWCFLCLIPSEHDYAKSHAIGRFDQSSQWLANRCLENRCPATRLWSDGKPSVLSKAHDPSHALRYWSKVDHWLGALLSYSRSCSGGQFLS